MVDQRRNRSKQLGKGLSVMGANLSYDMDRSASILGIGRHSHEYDNLSTTRKLYEKFKRSGRVLSMSEEMIDGLSEEEDPDV